jgi:uncharacterized membrane protein YjjP (DUF1212 family)
MTLQERSDLILSFARVLYVNGQATEQTVGAAEEVGRSLGIRATIIPRWGELELQVEDKGGSLFAVVAADPPGVDMDRVASTMRAVRDLGSDRIAPDATMQALGKIARAPPAPTMLFALAAGAGAIALAVIFGVAHLAPVILIFVSAASGAVLRRGLGKLSTNVFIQPFCAALLAGLIGAVAVRYSQRNRLISVVRCAT